MAQITLNSSGVASSGALVLQSNGTTTAVTVSTGQVATFANDAVVNGLTVGRGLAAVATNTAVGASALAANTTGANNTGIGNNALVSNTTGNRNSSVGRSALGSATTGSDNSALGYFALQNTTTGANNTAIGVSALESNSTASANTAVGYQAGYSNTTGNAVTFVGNKAGSSNTTGAQPVFVGHEAGYANTTGAQNVAMGDRALTANTTGGTNTALGGQALTANTTASNNTAVGYQAGYNFTTSNENTVLGYAAGKGGATGQTGIVCLGAYAGAYQRTATGSGVILIGAQADVASAANSFEIVIGYNTTGKGASTGFINPNSGGVYQGNNSSAWSTTSDRRLKKNIVDNNTGLDKITAIQVRNFEYRLMEEVDAELKPSDAIKKSGVQLGVIAQELNEVLPECVKTESTGVMSVNSDNLTWYMVNAIKELKAEIDSLKSQINGASA